MQKKSTVNLITAALCIAVGIIIPAIFHSLGIPGNVFLPMHMPVLLCGFLCGYKYGGLCGLVLPLISSAITGMPPVYPVGIAMVFELAAYGILAGLLYPRLKTYPSLILAMLGGRAVSGIINSILFAIAAKPYGIKAFITAAFAVSLPGIILQIVLIPLIMIVLNRTNLIDRNRSNE